jgi:hypothetical protein
MNESLATYLMRRSGDMRAHTDVRLDQINNWLGSKPEQPQRVWSLIALLITALHREIEERTTIIVDEQMRTKVGHKSIFGR